MSEDLNVMKADRQVQRVRELLSAWLNHSEWSEEELLDWLQGYKLPPVGYDYEPFTWMMRGLAISDERDRLEEELTNRLAKLLEGQPDVVLEVSRPSEALYNLFMLCAELERKDILGEFLYEIFERQKLDGTWRGVSLRYAFAVALAHNQLDNRLEQEWREMAAGQKHDFLLGSQYDGFEAILMMPPVQESTEPALDAIGYSLKCMASFLEGKHNRRPEFQSFLNKVRSKYKNRSSWNLDLIEQADKNSLPRWSITCFPSLCFPKSLNESNTLILWEIYLDILKKYDYKYKTQQQMCDGRISIVKIERDASPFIDFIKHLEEARMEITYPNYSAVIAAIHHRFMELKDNLDFPLPEKIRTAVMQRYILKKVLSAIA